MAERKQNRVQVTLTEEMLKQIDDYAKMTGQTRSGICAYFILQGVLAVGKSFEVLEKYGKSSLEEQNLT